MNVSAALKLDGSAALDGKRMVDRLVTQDPATARPAPLASKLDLVGKLAQRSILPRVLRVAKGERLDSPLVVDLDPTTFCDLACPECISSGVLNQGQFSAGRLESLASELVEAGVRGVILIGGGEPLVHRSIGRVITTLSDGGVHLGMVTNGTLIDRHLDVLANRMSWIRVSVDAATREIYDLFRPSGRAQSVFPKVIANMEKLAKVKRGRLGYSFLLMQRKNDAGVVIESNYDQVLAAGKLAKSVGCDYIEVKAMFDAEHFIVNEASDDIRRVDDQLLGLEEIEDEHFRVLRSSTWNDLRRNVDREQPKAYSKCSMSELRATITPNGVYTCAYHRGNEKGLIGDVRDMPFAEMWRRADTQRLNPAVDCRFHCARDSSNRAIHDLRTGSSALAVDDYDPFI